jgi:hypothetical protein
MHEMRPIDDNFVISGFQAAGYMHTTRAQHTGV